MFLCEIVCDVQREVLMTRNPIPYRCSKDRFQFRGTPRVLRGQISLSDRQTDGLDQRPFGLMPPKTTPGPFRPDTGY